MFWKVLSSEKGNPVAIPPVSDGPHGELALWLLRWFVDAGDQERELMVQAAYGLWLARNEARDGKRLWTLGWLQRISAYHRMDSHSYKATEVLLSSTGARVAQGKLRRSSV